MDVMAAAREKNVRTLDEIKYAVLERNGGISIIKNKRLSTSDRWCIVHAAHV